MNSFAVLTLLGLVADRGIGIGFTVVQSAAFGTSPDFDAYLVAIAAPMLLATLLGDVLYSQLLPEFSATRGHAPRTSRSTVFGTSIGLLLVITLAYGVGWWSLGPMLSHESVDIRLLGVVLAPLIVLGGVSSLSATLLVADRRYRFAAVRFPLNTALCMVFFVFQRPWGLGIYGLALSVLMGYAATAVLTMSLAVGSLRHEATSLGWEPFAFLRRVSRDSFAQVVSAASIQATTIVERLIGLGVGPGVVSALNYGRIAASPPLLIAQSISTASYAAFVRNAHQEDRARFRQLADTIALLTFLLLPLSVLVATLARPAVRLVFQRGTFTEDSAVATAITAAILAGGLVPTAVSAVAARFLYAEGRSASVARINLAALILYFALALGLSRVAGYVGLAGASTAISVITAVALMTSIRPPIGERWVHVPIGSFIRTGLAAAAMLLISVAAAGALSRRSDMLIVVVGSLLGLLVFAFAAAVLRSTEMGRALELWRHRPSGRHRPALPRDSASE